MTKTIRMFAVLISVVLFLSIFMRMDIAIQADNMSDKNTSAGIALMHDISSDILPTAEAKIEPKQLYRESYITMVTVTDTLNIRKGPGTDTDVMGYVAEGTVIRVMSQDSDEWIGIDFNGSDGYISTKYVTLYSQIKENTKEAYDAEIELLLASLIQCEAGGEPYEGQVAVGTVVMNRVESDDFPDNIYDVIYQPDQFTPVTSGKVDKIYDSGIIQSSCIQAAEEVLSGVSNVDGCLYFHRYDGCDGLIIGNHVFKDVMD